MAQLNPNFEIDFSDINSYEQIQLINDTQLAKENLLMHRAYKEPSDDEIIRNHFSSFTFVDFCPKVFLSSPKVFSSSRGVILSSVRENQLSSGSPEISQQNLDLKNSKAKTYELESFSDLFDRINSWLKLNKDWRVVSMQTLVYDCGSQFNHLKSSIHSNYLPQNTRGLRLFLSPSKSRFSGPQKIGCINVVPRKISTSHLSSSPPPQTCSSPDSNLLTSSLDTTTTNDPKNASSKTERKVIYETLDQILQRLNELLLTRPIEGRILSVETITLPMVNGYVNTESNFFADTTLNGLNLATYSPGTMISGHQEPSGGSHSDSLQGQSLIDILRVYYEFGPMVCGLVNLIDFIPRFYSPTITTGTPAGNDGSESTTSLPEATNTNETGEIICDCEQMMNSKMPATESLTRLIKRSLAWFESERKRILNETIGEYEEKRGGDVGADANRPAANNDAGCGVDLKLCNLQVHHKSLFKAQLIQANRSTNVHQLINTRTMAHEKCNLVQLLAKQWIDTLPSCPQCMNINPTLKTIEQQVQDRLIKSANLIQLAQAYQLKYIRLAYIVPVYNKYAVRSVWPLYQIKTPPAGVRPSNDRSESTTPTADDSQRAAESRKLSSADGGGLIEQRAGSAEVPELARAEGEDDELVEGEHEEEEEEEEVEDEDEELDVDEEEEEGEETSSSGSDDSSLGEPDQRFVKELLKADGREEERVKQAALRLVESTRQRHQRHEEAHQASDGESSATDATGNENSLIGQLTYRLFAPCQLVNSSSCFAINPVNSNSPLARRGSVDLNGAGPSQDNAQTHFLNYNNHIQEPSSPPANLMSSLGGLFPSLGGSQDAFPTGSGCHLNQQPPGEIITQPQYSTLSVNTTSPIGRLTTNEFESVEAIKRRMEIYVTTNSMKVVAGETLVVNLSDVLSCLSTAIEQTLVRAPFVQRGATTWVSVYVLYAAVAEPHQPSQLLAQQKLRDLSLINEEDDVEKGSAEEAEADNQIGKIEPVRPDQEQIRTLTTATLTRDGSLRVEQSKPMESSQSTSLYNSAYDRTVPLPIAPNASTSGASQELAEFFESQDNFFWLNENHQLIEVRRTGSNSNCINDNRHLIYSGSSLMKRARARKTRKIPVGTKRPKKGQVDSQCSII